MEYATVYKNFTHGDHNHASTEENTHRSKGCRTLRFPKTACRKKGNEKKEVFLL
jgi:hypothetical protein